MQLKILSIFLILIIGTISIFSFLGMGLLGNGTQHICPISAIFGGDCPPIGSALLSASHHIAHMQYFAQSTIGPNLILFTFSFLFFIALFLISLKLLQQTSQWQYFILQRHNALNDLWYKLNKQFLHWASLHNKQDTHALAWVYV